jgi:glycosyltransferase involved in cell wall biosynthesis
MSAGHHARLLASAPEIVVTAVAEGVECTELPVGHTSLRAARCLRRAVGDYALDVLVVDRPRDLRQGALAVWGRPVALVNRFNYAGWRAPRDMFSRMSYRRVDLTVFLTTRGLVRAQQQAPFMMRRPFIVIPEGVDCDFYRPDPTAGQAFRQRYRLGSGRLLVAVGALEEEKRYEDLVEALARVPAPRAVLVLGGKGSQRDRLAAQACRLGIDLQLVGHLTPSDLVGAYNAATVFVHPSPVETFGLTVLEAMACGRPVIGVGGGGVPEVVGDAGVIVAPGDPERLAAAIATLLGDEQKCRVWGTRARTRAVERFGLNRMRAGYARALELVAAKRWLMGGDMDGRRCFPA